MAGMGALLLHDAWRLLRAAEVAAAISLEGALGTHTTLDERIHALRPQPGQAACASRMRALLRGSSIPQSHRDDPRVQDPYSLRCIPQVFGAARDALAFVEQVISNELGAVTDNPLLFPDKNWSGSRPEFIKKQMGRKSKESIWRSESAISRKNLSAVRR